MMRRALAQLDLTDNQKEQVRAIVETSRERARELRRQRTDEAREARHALRRETRRLIHDVLTPAQRDDLGRIMIEHHARKMERRIDHMTKRLQLSDEQVEQVRGIFEASRARAETLRESDLPRDEKRAQWRELKTDAREAVRSVLTAEQQAKLSELRERHGRRRGQGRR
jgi:Spy/CpxP family protein refolding chaperone